MSPRRPVQRHHHRQRRRHQRQVGDDAGQHVQGQQHRLGVAAPTDVTVAAMKTAARGHRQVRQATIGGATSQVVTHNLNTQAVVVDVYRTLTPWDTVECDVERTDRQHGDAALRRRPGRQRVLLRGGRMSRKSSSRSSCPPTRRRRWRRRPSSTSMARRATRCSSAPTDPIATYPKVEVWYDTDATTYDVSSANPQNALGVVAIGSFTCRGLSP